MAADLPDVSGVFSSTVQGYATLGASLVLGLITIYGYFRKLTAESNLSTVVVPPAGQTMDLENTEAH